MLAAAGRTCRKWSEMDKLILTDGDVIDHAQIKSDLLEWIGGENLRELGFDPWSAMQFSLALAEREGYRWWRFRRRFAICQRP